MTPAGSTKRLLVLFGNQLFSGRHVAEARPDETALAELCDKWGRGGAAGQAGREGALWLVGRMLRLAAKHAVSPDGTDVCEFEVAAIDRLAATRSAAARWS